MTWFTNEYNRSNGVTSSNAVAAYQAGATGQGVKVAVIDTGINPSLPDFAGRIDPASRDVAGTRGLGDLDGHGTAVASVIAGAKDDLRSHGVAFNATIVALRADQPGTCGTDDDCSFYDSAIAAGIDAARLAGAKVVNMSLGGSAPGLQVMNAISRGVTAGVIFVISAGNDGTDPSGINPDGFALVPAQTFPNHVIIAGSVGTSTDPNAISTFSNKAGTGSANYLAALGYRVLTIDQNGTEWLYSGTSFSAPVISGAVALVAQAFPNLTGPQIIQLLFTTADDLGEAGVDTTYGRGKLNIARAFQPVGTRTLADSQIAVGPDTVGDLPDAAGDGGEDGDNGKSDSSRMGVVILDGFSRAFTMDLASGLKRAARAEPLRRALAADTSESGLVAGPLQVAMTLSHNRSRPQMFDLAPLGIGPEDARRARLVAASLVARVDDKTAVALGFAEGAKAMEKKLQGTAGSPFLIARDTAAEPGFSASRSGSLAVRRSLGPVNLTVSGESGTVFNELRTNANSSPYRLATVTLDKDFGRTFLAAGISRLEERETLLGGRLGAAFGGGGSSTTFLDLEARRELGKGFALGVTGRHGWTEFAGGRFRTNAFAVEASKEGVFQYTDRLALRVAQPLRIASGGFALLLPTSYDYVTQSAGESLVRYSLTPSGREIVTELGYTRHLLGGWVSGNLFYRNQPGHRADAKGDAGVALRYKLSF